MAKLYVSYGNGRKEFVASIEEAEELIEVEYPEAEYGDWEQDSFDGERTRCLVWANEEDAEDDPGFKAIAEIVRED